MSARMLAVKLAALFTLCWAPLASAHSGIDPGHGLADGFMHPATGLDHILLVIMAGYWATRRGSHGVPGMLFFLLLFAGGLLLGIACQTWLAVDILLSLQFVLIAAIIAMAIAFVQYLYHVLFGGLALYYGVIHMLEAPATGSPLTFALGLFISTAVLLKLGLILRTVIAAFRAHRTG